ncbi:MAG: sigma-70 family RNA polymerase sigma factor [Candidatus Omnitrophota bacterium]
MSLRKSEKKGLIRVIPRYNLSMDEQEFIQRCLNQERAVWDEFVDKYSRLIYNYIYSILKIKGISLSSDVVEELFQEIFLGLIKDNFQKLRQFRGKNKASLASWLRIITINFCLDYLRKEKKIKPFSLEEDFISKGFSLKDILANRSTSPDQVLTDQERLGHLYECIDTLGVQDKYFLEMHIYQGMGLDDLQLTLGVSRSAVDMRKSRLIQKLRDCFKGKGFLLDL